MRGKTVPERVRTRSVPNIPNFEVEDLINIDGMAANLQLKSKQGG